MASLITTETFYDIPVRIAQGENGPMIPLVDIAHGLGYDPQVIYRLYDRNRELLEKYTQTAMMATGDQVAPLCLTCLSRDGIIGLTIKLDYRRVKTPEKKARVLNFQTWSIETLGKVMDGTLQSSQPLLPPLSDALKEEMARADAMTIVGVDLSRSVSACMSKLEEEYDTDLGYLRRLVPRKAQSQIAYLTATAIGKKFGISGKKINTILDSLKFINSNTRIKKTGDTQKIWNLTDAGQDHGEIILERHGGSDVSYILWKDSVVDIIRGLLDITDSQKLLTDVGV